MDDLRKALFRALEKSDVNMLRAVLAQGVSLDYEADDLHPVFMEAINGDRNDIEVLEILKSAGADPTIRDRNGGDCGLHWAIARETPDVLEWLLRQGLSADSRNTAGITPLMRSVRWSADWSEDRLPERALGLRDCRILIAAGASLDAADEDGRTALHYAARSNLGEALEILLSQGARPNVRACDGETPLIAAAGGCHPAAVARLLAHGADANLHDDCGSTPLHLIAADRHEASGSERAQVAEALVAAGADLTRLDSHGDTSLVAAADDNDVDTARVLIQHGADVGFGTSRALCQALFFEYDEMVDLLLSSGAPCDLRFGEAKTTPLHLAAQENYPHGIDALLDRGVTIDACDIDGETPLMTAVRRGGGMATERLLARGADRHHTDHYGNTALSWAQRRKDARLIKLLSQ